MAVRVLGQPMLPRLGADLKHPDHARPESVVLPGEEEISRWNRRAAKNCKKCVATGHEYGKDGLFKRCPCRIPLEAPAHVQHYFRSNLYFVF